MLKQYLRTIVDVIFIEVKHRMHLPFVAKYERFKVLQQQIVFVSFSRTLMNFHVRPYILPIHYHSISE